MNCSLSMTFFVYIPCSWFVRAISSDQRCCWSMSRYIRHQFLAVFYTSSDDGKFNFNTRNLETENWRFDEYKLASLFFYLVIRMTLIIWSVNCTSQVNHLNNGKCSLCHENKWNSFRVEFLSNVHCHIQYGNTTLLFFLSTIYCWNIGMYDDLPATCLPIILISLWLMFKLD